MANEAPFTDMFTWYEKLYTAVDKSWTYAEYCRRVHGSDMSQQNFCTKGQIDFLLSKLLLSKDKKVLDIGCGTGKLAEYISDTTGAIVTGFDYSPTAIRIASERTKSKRNRLIFEVGNINDDTYPNDKFDVVISVDTLYFADNLLRIVSKFYSNVHSKGKLAFYYGIGRFDKNESNEILLPDKSPLANAFADAGLTYSVYNFTIESYEHHKLKRKTALDLKKDFEMEGNTFLFDYLFRESIEIDMSFEEFMDFSRRYLYILEKP